MASEPVSALPLMEVIFSQLLHSNWPRADTEAADAVLLAVFQDSLIS
jgi:hypothetical protein